MKATALLLWIMGGSFLLIDVIYLVWSMQAHNLELVGLLTVGLSGVLCVLLAFYFGRAVKVADNREWAEDRPDAEIDDGDAGVGFYSPWSWWPVLLACAAGLVFVGFAISAWIAILAAPFLIVTLVGWTFQYYRGYFAR